MIKNFLTSLGNEAKKFFFRFFVNTNYIKLGKKNKDYSKRKTELNKKEKANISQRQISYLANNLENSHETKTKKIIKLFHLPEVNESSQPEVIHPTSPRPDGNGGNAEVTFSLGLS